MEQCYFCKNKSALIDFKETETLKRYISGLGKIRAKNKTLLCAKHQRIISRIIKQARHLGLLSAVKK